MAGKAITFAFLAIAPIVSGPSWAGDTILKKAPEQGGLLPGQRVLVDDGSCPRGQIREIIGGSNRIYSWSGERTGTKRTQKCIKAL